MKLPRDVEGKDLAKKLSGLGYEIVRQTGSHIRLTKAGKSEHHITIPAHKNIKIGTLHSIFVDIAKHLKITKEEVINKIW